ncbi:MerR family DNA-binding transcriptional regulator [Paenibacillus sp. CF384]|uniref:MerR family DNA-binding transcriptional regulator n=1 Tax=Paenibacillus sp. CF384 TaxID=1884382 RepID=UPI00089B9B84|nr:MerR family DNA-binding transcriptional regulator [Paenibacillus sp. CF384]SDW19178.1 DNA-binding transcriptional regulator, MerR family [Paenibacillus sp. CF384]
MQRTYKPIEIARALNLSTSALRHYESWGVVPAPERGANGYRLYTDIHLAYFRCLRTMFAGFGVAVTCDVLRHIQAGQMNAAFWLVNKEQALLQQDKSAADQTLELLHQLALPDFVDTRRKNPMSIGEAAALAGVTTSALRHWEKEELLTPLRDSDNGYRLYNALHIRQILIIRTLRSTVYLLRNLKDIVHAVEHQSVEQAMKLTENAIQGIHARIRNQFQGVHQLVELCKAVKLID